jgi:hypothetical protein
MILASFVFMHRKFFVFHAMNPSAWPMAAQPGERGRPSREEWSAGPAGPLWPIRGGKEHMRRPSRGGLSPSLVWGAGAGHEDVGLEGVLSWARPSLSRGLVEALVCQPGCRRAGRDSPCPSPVLLIPAQNLECRPEKNTGRPTLAQVGPE